MTFNILKFHMRDYVRVDANNNIIIEHDATLYRDLNMGKLMNELIHKIIIDKLAAG